MKEKWEAHIKIKMKMMPTIRINIVRIKWSRKKLHKRKKLIKINNNKNKMFNKKIITR